MLTGNTKRLVELSNTRNVYFPVSESVETMKELIEELAESKLVKVTGSYADNTQNGFSDIDFFVKPDDPDYRNKGKERNMSKIIKILKKYGVNTDSSFPGYIFTHKSENDIPIQLEFSDLFTHRKNRLPEVEIMGVTFKTH